MKGKYLNKMLRPSTRSRTQQDEAEKEANFHVLFPEERVALKPLKNFVGRHPKEFYHQDIRRRYHPPQSANQNSKALGLPKIDKLENSQVKTDTLVPTVSMNNRISDNEFLDMKELTENPQKSVYDNPVKSNDRHPPMHQNIGSFKHGMRSQVKRRNQKSPPPIILESPLLNRFLKVSRHKASSLNHRSGSNPLEMTFFPHKDPVHQPVL